MMPRNDDDLEAEPKGPKAARRAEGSGEKRKRKQARTSGFDEQMSDKEAGLSNFDYYLAMLDKDEDDPEHGKASIGRKKQRNETVAQLAGFLSRLDDLELGPKESAGRSGPPGRESN